MAIIADFALSDPPHIACSRDGFSAWVPFRARSTVVGEYAPGSAGTPYLVELRPDSIGQRARISASPSGVGALGWGAAWPIETDVDYGGEQLYMQFRSIDSDDDGTDDLGESVVLGIPQVSLDNIIVLDQSTITTSVLGNEVLTGGIASSLASASRSTDTFTVTLGISASGGGAIASAHLNAAASALASSHGSASVTQPYTADIGGISVGSASAAAQMAGHAAVRGIGVAMGATPADTGTAPPDYYLTDRALGASGTCRELSTTNSSTSAYVQSATSTTSGIQIQLGKVDKIDSSRTFTATGSAQTITPPNTATWTPMDPVVFSSFPTVGLDERLCIRVSLKGSAGTYVTHHDWVLEENISATGNLSLVLIARYLTGASGMTQLIFGDATYNSRAALTADSNWTFNYNFEDAADGVDATTMGWQSVGGGTLPATREYDSATSVQGTRSLLLKDASTTHIWPPNAARVSGDGAQEMWWFKGADLSPATAMSFLDNRNGSPLDYISSFRCGANYLDVYTRAVYGWAAGYNRLQYENASEQVVDFAVSNNTWYRIRVVYDFTNKTYRVHAKEGIEGTERQLGKWTGTQWLYDVPFRVDATHTETHGITFSVSTANNNCWVDCYRGMSA